MYTLAIKKLDEQKTEKNISQTTYDKYKFPIELLKKLDEMGINDEKMVRNLKNGSSIWKELQKLKNGATVKNFFLKMINVDKIDIHFDLFKLDYKYKDEKVKEREPTDDKFRGPNYLYNHTKLEPIDMKRVKIGKINDGGATFA